MEHPIVEKILKEGVNSVNLSMLDESTRKSILSHVGRKLYKQNKIAEAAEILGKAGDFEMLKKLGDEFAEQNKGELAAICLIPTKDKERLNNAAIMCIQAKNYRLAADAYKAAGNMPMAEFMEKNFC